MINAQPLRFQTTRRSRMGAFFFVVVFLLWSAATGYALLATPAQRPFAQAWLGYLILVGTPVGMLVMSALYALALYSALEVDSDGARMSGPLGTQELRWKDVAYYNLLGTEDQGISAVLNSGKKMAFNFAFYEDAEDLRAFVIPRMPIDQGAAPIVAVRSGKTAIAIVTASLLGFFTVGAIVARMPQIIGVIVLLALVLLPLTVYTFTYQAIIFGTEIRTTSCFGTTRILIDADTVVKEDESPSRSGKQIQLTVKSSSGQKILFTSRSDRFPEIRARILSLKAAADAQTGHRHRS